jgi:ankyrin repeat protein
MHMYAHSYDFAVSFLEATHRRLQDQQGQTPLMAAVRQRDLKSVQLLLAAVRPAVVHVFVPPLSLCSTLLLLVVTLARTQARLCAPRTVQA